MTPTPVRVLLIDDDNETRDAIERLLNSFFPAWEIVSEEKAMKGLERLQSEELFDIILLDIIMPDMNGIALYKKLLKEGSNRVHRIVFMTGMGAALVIETFMRESPRPVIEKPIWSAELALLLQRFVESDAPRGP